MRFRELDAYERRLPDTRKAEVALLLHSVGA
jgi:hypothetical protein